MNCKPGDLAITVNGNVVEVITPGILGRVVQVVRRAYPGDVFLSVDGHPIRWVNNVAAWVVRAPRPLPWLIGEGKHKGRVFLLTERAMPDANLRRIGGEHVHDEHHDEIPA